MNVTEMPALNRREIRKKPPNGSSGRGPLLFIPGMVAPNASDHNTLELDLWVEVKVVNDRGTPLAGERCKLWAANGTVLEQKTDEHGIVRFKKLPLTIGEDVAYEDIYQPPLQLPDILEEWRDPVGDFMKRKYQREGGPVESDCMVRFVPANTPQYEIKINRLTEAEKFEHFLIAYESNGADYESAKQGSGFHHPLWKWGDGAKCNQHVNFFLGYWFNYNQQFKTANSAGVMLDLPLVDSENSLSVQPKRHRNGYSEFLEPIDGIGHSYKAHGQEVQYLRLSQYFEKDGTPNEEGSKLLTWLRDVNVYSVADIYWDKDLWPGRTEEYRRAGAHDVRLWLVKQDEDHPRRGNRTNAQIHNLSDTAIWDITWDIKEDDENAAEILRRLWRSYVDVDHHAGIIVRLPFHADPAPAAGADGSDAETRRRIAEQLAQQFRDAAEGRVVAPKYHTFTADSDKPILLRDLAEEVKKRKYFAHFAIWRPKPLRPGGYALSDATTDTGKKIEEQPSRPIEWF